jgi:hypothetical protein
MYNDDSDSGSSYCEEDESWGSDWEEDFGEEDQPVPIKDQPVPIKDQPVPIKDQPVPIKDQPVSIKDPSPPPIIKETSPPPIIKEPTPPPPAIITKEPTPPPVETEDPKPKDPDLPKQIRPTAHLSGFESSKSVPTPLMKFGTRHVSIPTSFGKSGSSNNSLKSEKKSQDRNKNNLKIDVKLREEVQATKSVMPIQTDSVREIPLESKNELLINKKSSDIPVKLIDLKLNSSSPKEDVVLTEETQTQNKESKSTRKVSEVKPSEKQKTENDKELQPTVDAKSKLSKSDEAKVVAESQPKAKTEVSKDTNATTPDASNLPKHTFKHETIPDKDQTNESKSPNQVTESNRTLERSQSRSESDFLPQLKVKPSPSSIGQSVREKQPSSPKSVDGFASDKQMTFKIDEPAVKQITPKPVEVTVKDTTPQTIEPTIEPSSEQVPLRIVETADKQITPKPVEPIVKQTTPKCAESPSPRNLKSAESSSPRNLKHAESSSPSPSPRNLKNSSSGIFNFKEQPKTMHRTESFSQTRDLRAKKFSDSSVSAPLVAGKTNLFPFPEPSHSRNQDLSHSSDRNQESSHSLLTDKQREPISPKQLKTETKTEVLPKIAESVSSLPAKNEEESTKTEISESKSTDNDDSKSSKKETSREQTLPTDVAVSEEEKSIEDIERRSILTTNEESNLSRNQKTNVSPPKHVHFKQTTPPSTPTPPLTPASTPTSPISKPFSTSTSTSTPTSSTASTTSRPRERKVRPTPTFQTVQPYQVHQSLKYS